MRYSVIIPVYNVEKYLERCIKSVLNQKSNDYEILLIDDGSTDSSPILCDYYAERYKSIRVFHQANGGLSNARNHGIDEAKGDYLLFLDSDDWIGQDSFEIFNCIIDKYPTIDLIAGKALFSNDIGEISETVRYGLKRGFYSIQDYLDKLLYYDSYKACAPYTIYKRQMIQMNNLKFKDAIIHEDELWTPMVLTQAKNVYFTDEYFYYHYIREGSITRSGNWNYSGINYMIVVGHLNKILDSLPKKDYKVIRNQCVILYLQAYCMLDDNREYASMLSKKWLLKNSFDLRTKIKSFLFALSPKFYTTLHSLLVRNS